MSLLFYTRRTFQAARVSKARTLTGHEHLLTVHGAFILAQILLHHRLIVLGILLIAERRLLEGFLRSILNLRSGGQQRLFVSDGLGSFGSGIIDQKMLFVGRRRGTLILDKPENNAGKRIKRRFSMKIPSFRFNMYLFCTLLVGWALFLG